MLWGFHPLCLCWIEGTNLEEIQDCIGQEASGSGGVCSAERLADSKAEPGHRLDWVTPRYSMHVMHACSCYRVLEQIFLCQNPYCSTRISIHLILPTFQFGCEKPGPIRVRVRVWATAYRATCVGREDWFAAAACSNPHTGGEFGWCECMKPMTWWWFQVSNIFCFYLLLGGMMLFDYLYFIILQMGWSHHLHDHLWWPCRKQKGWQIAWLSWTHISTASGVEIYIVCMFHVASCFWSLAVGLVMFFSLLIATSFELIFSYRLFY